MSRKCPAQGDSAAQGHQLCRICPLHGLGASPPSKGQQPHDETWPWHWERELNHGHFQHFHPGAAGAQGAELWLVSLQLPDQVWVLVPGSPLQIDLLSTQAPLLAAEANNTVLIAKA